MVKASEGSNSNNHKYGPIRSSNIRFKEDDIQQDSSSLNHKRDEWRSNSSEIQRYNVTQHYNPTIQARHVQTAQQRQQQRVSLATSSDSFLKVGTDRSSISKLLAKRRASAPIVSMRANAAHARTLVPGVESSKGASVEVYGFVCWITSFVAYAFFLLWGFLPERLLRSLGVYYFPNKYWVIATPSYFMVAVLFGILTYICVNLMNTDPLHSYHTFSDKTPSQDHGYHEHESSVPAATDIPLTLVNELLYQKKKPASEVSPNFTKLTNVRNSPRAPRVFPNRNKSSLEDLISREWDRSGSISSNDSGDNSEGEGSSSSSLSSLSSLPVPKLEYAKRSHPLSSPLSPSPSSSSSLLSSSSAFSPSSPSSSSSSRSPSPSPSSSLPIPDSPIRRTSSYSLLKEDL